MPTHLRVLGGVTVGRTVTTQRRAARLTGTQMDPTVTGLDALLALMAFLVFDGPDGAEVNAG